LFLLFINGVLLGLGAAAPIGPVNVEIARRTLRFGRGAGFLLGVGAVTIDVGYAVVTSFTLVPVMRYPRVLTVLSGAAAVFLMYLAWQCLRAALCGHKENEGEVAATTTETLKNVGASSMPMPTPTSTSKTPAPPPAAHYVTGLLLTALNPMTLAFWFVAVPGAVAGLIADSGTHGGGGFGALPLVCAGVFTGAFAWVCFFTTLIGRLGRFGRQRWLAWIDLAGGLTLLAFAVRTIWRLFAPPL